MWHNHQNQSNEKLLQEVQECPHAQNFGWGKYFSTYKSHKMRCWMIVWIKKYVWNTKLTFLSPRKKSLNLKMSQTNLVPQHVQKIKKLQHEWLPMNKNIEDKESVKTIIED